MKRNNKSALYESIMRQVGAVVRNAINEGYASSTIDEVENVVEDTLCGYDCDEVDMMYNEYKETAYLFFHSDNNSYPIEGTDMNVAGIDVDELEAICDRWNIALCFDEGIDEGIDRLSDIDFDDEEDEMDEGIDRLSDIDFDDEEDEMDECGYRRVNESLDIDELEDMYLGKTIRIIHMDDPFGGRYEGKTGKVTRVEITPGDEPGTRAFQMHGTWGGCAVIPDHDEFEFV